MSMVNTDEDENEEMSTDVYVGDDDDLDDEEGFRDEGAEGKKDTKKVKTNKK